jgi:hypothetical protein
MESQTKLFEFGYKVRQLCDGKWLHEWGTLLKDFNVVCNLI